jgi:hypothetical protein
MLPSIAFPACWTPSPLAVPPGPNAAALTGLSARAGIADGVVALADGLAGWVLAVCVLGTTAGRWVAADLLVWPTPETNL